MHQSAPVHQLYVYVSVLAPWLTFVRFLNRLADADQSYAQLAAIRNEHVSLL